MLYAFTENFVLPFSHDEVVYGKRSMLEKMPGDAWQQHASLRVLYGYFFAHPGKKLMFMGAEFGQRHEWNHDASLDWDALAEPLNQGLQRWVRDLNAAYRHEASLHQVDFDRDGFDWIDCHDADHSVVSLVRRARDGADFTVAVANFTPVPRSGYVVGVPDGGWYREILNSDGASYGGSNMGNAGGVAADGPAAHGFLQSIRLTVPPLGFVLLKRS
jgi:1,4-alpha-glucan branching enzyme